jgi:hypothetical protein
VLPAVAEVEDEPELVAGSHRGSHLDGRVVLDHLVVLEGIRIDASDPPATGELELVLMREVRPRRCRVDRVR